MRVLGIDTGGTYTDSVIVERERGAILRRAKALTTPHDLAVGVEESIGRLNYTAWDKIGLVCLSTTLATNAVVEGKGGRAGLLLLGGVPCGPLPVQAHAVVGARVNIRGGVQERLDAQALRDALTAMRGQYDALAISGYASVRNPAHEQQAARAAREILHIPVVCGHELTADLGFYERTVTAVWNARLIPVVRTLMETIQNAMQRLGIRAPIMIVRGDGSLMHFARAMERPVETILSGPAASVIGARFLTGLTDCMVVDMGGTTTDIAYVRAGRCRVTRSGAQIAGWRTNVRAMEICTYGLGGDSRIEACEDGRLAIGPERVVPLCRSGVMPGKSGLTPTDILHLSGLYREWDVERIRPEAERICACMHLPPQLFAGEMTRRIVSRLQQACRAHMERLNAPRDLPIVGVGAPAGIWLRLAEQRLKQTVYVPRDAAVANAVGAAVGTVYETAQAIVRKDRLNGQYLIYTETERMQADDLTDAVCCARQAVRTLAADRAAQAGLKKAEVTDEQERRTGAAGELIEVRLHAVAQGSPA